MTEQEGVIKTHTYALLEQCYWA